MTASAALPLLLLATSFVPAVVIFLLREEQRTARTALNLGGALVKVVLVAVVLVGVAGGAEYEWRARFLPGLDLILRVEPIPLIFVGLSAFLWLFTTIYAIAYLEGSPRRSQFFGFFSLCVTATVGIALAGNPITFLIFYELLTVATYPLVVHRGTPAALKAGQRYLLYTVAGGTVLLFGVVWLHAIAGPIEFRPGGTLAGATDAPRWQLVALFAVLVGGLGVKAALFPLHGWLPQAMVAPAPVSALLHAVAVVKAGAYGIVRIVYDLYGVDLASELGVLTPLAAVASFTIIYGSLRALAQQDLKRRLAYSTVSQLSYITLGVAIVGFTSTTGGLAHLVHQGIMKVTLFYCAGNLAETLGLHRVDELQGVGRRMPVTMTAFTIAALGMIGLPPTAGFVSKWYLGLGGIYAGEPWVLAVILTSSLLNAAYFLPIVYSAWFEEREHGWGESRTESRWETSWGLLLPAVATAAATLAAGLFAGADVSPLAWAEFIAAQVWGP
jgi:multicomponent Na+:H+ antiporter subunit D